MDELHVAVCAKCGSSLQGSRKYCRAFSFGLLCIDTVLQGDISLGGT
jgi:hypothetical protein